MSIVEHDLPQQVSRSLVDTYGESQNSRYRGYFVSQSLRELLSFIDSEDIIELGATRQSSMGKKDLLNVKGNGQTFIRVREERKADIRVSYDRMKHGPFDGKTVISLLDDEDLLQDIPIKRVVYRFEHDNLLEHLETLVEDAIGLDPWWLEQPFYAVLESHGPGSDSVYDQVRDYHDDRYFNMGGGDRRGLGWKVRTLDFTELWSHRGWCHPKEVIASSGHGDSLEKFTVRDIEREVFNHQPEPDERGFGAVNSALVINRWRSAFGRGRTDLKSWVWEQSEGWIRAP